MSGSRLAGRRILVIGAAPGQIGGAIARRLADEGATLAIGDLHIAKAQDTADSLGSSVAQVASVDVAEEESVAEFTENAARKLGAIDGLVNNAALLEETLLDTDVVDIELSALDRLLAVNLKGHMLSCRHAIPHLKAAGGGSIVLMASTSGIQGEPTRTTYGVAKAGVISLARHVAARWGKQGIRCNTISPGKIVTGESPTADTPILQAFLDATAYTRLGHPDDISGATAFLLSDDAAFVNGTNLAVDGGFTEVLPIRPKVGRPRAARNRWYTSRIAVAVVGLVTNGTVRPAPESDAEFYHRFPFVRPHLAANANPIKE